MPNLAVKDAVGSTKYLKKDGAGTDVDPHVGHVVVDSGTVKEVRSSTSAHTNVAASATNVTVLAANANRLGATIFNDSTADLFLKLGATASTTSFTCKVVANGYYEVPFGYTGVIDGIWASATGAARVAEFT